MLAIRTLSSLTLLSRLAGLVREIVVTALIGPGPIMDAYTTALKLPNMFRQMFAEGALSASFIPLYTEVQENQGESAAKVFTDRVASVLLLGIGAATAAAIVFMEPLIGLLRFEEGSQSFELTVLYTRIMSVYLLCMVMASLLTGVLNAKAHFAAGAFAPIFLNVCIIAGLVGIYFISRPDQEGLGLTLAISVAVAGTIQVGFLWLVAVQKFKFRLGLRAPRMTPDVQRLFRLMGPGMLAAGGLQLNTLVGLYLASGGTNELSYLGLAERLYMLPVGLIAVAFGVAALPQLSAFFANNQRPQAIETINTGAELALVIAVPAACGLWALDLPIVKLLFERGQTTDQDSVAIAALLSVFVLALPALALQRVFNASFHSRKLMRLPMVLTLLGVFVNVVVALWLYERLGVVAIPIALAVSGWVQMLLLAVLVWRDGLLFPTPGRLWRAFAVLIAGAIMAICLKWLWAQAAPIVGDSGLLLLVATAALVLAGAVIYFAALIPLGGLSPAVWALVGRR